MDDSRHFVLEHFDAICNSPSQIYHSALPFCPSSSWLHKHYTAELSQEVKVVKGLPTGWGTCSRTVTLGGEPLALTCWKDMIAVGLKSGKIITLNGITGIQTATLSGHSDSVRCLTFFPDGTPLVSGGRDGTTNFWDVQTGGVIKAFHEDRGSVAAVSISADCTVLALGFDHMKIYLWDIQAEKLRHIIELENCVRHVRFSPTDPQHLVSVYHEKVQHWDINSCQSNHTHNGSWNAFSLDGTQFAACNGGNIVVRNPSSRRTVAKFCAERTSLSNCCFSPDGGLIAAVDRRTIYVWDTTSLHPHPIKSFVGHTLDITSLEFFTPSSLISSSVDKSVKFWEIGTLQAAPVVADSESTSLPSARILSITLQVEDGIVISSDLHGVVKIWDISTGLCKSSFQTSAKNPQKGDARLINNRLIFVWYYYEKIQMWDVERGEFQAVDITWGEGVNDVRISGDGSNVFWLSWFSIKCWAIQTGELVGEVGPWHDKPQSFLSVDGSRVWVCSPLLEPLGWDFGTPGPPFVQLSNSVLHLPSNAKVWDIGQPRIQDAVTGRVIFQFAGRFANPVKSQWDGRYLVAGYEFGEVLILEFNCVHNYSALKLYSQPERRTEGDRPYYI